MSFSRGECELVPELSHNMQKATNMPESFRTQKHFPRTLLLLGLTSLVAQTSMASLASCPFKLPSSNNTQGSAFGSSVSISGDTAMVGAPSTSSGATGVVTTYARNWSGQWTETGQLTSSDQAGNNDFGRSISVDGDTALVGAIGDDDNGSSSGSAYIFKQQQDGTWLETAKLTASDGGSYARFGHSVALSGMTAVIGANNDNGNGDNSGSAYIFEQQPDGTWLETAKLTASDADHWESLGSSVDISGTTVLIGAPYDDDNGSYSGSAYIFSKQNDGNWLQSAKLTASDGESYDQFAFSVSLSDETALVGAFYSNQPGLKRTGSAYVFQQDDNGTWLQVDKLTASNAQEDDYFGRSVSVDGDYAIVAAPSIMDSNLGPGSVYTFQRTSGNDWLETTIITPADGELEDGFGSSVCLASDDLIIGMPGDDDFGNSSGSAYLTSLSTNSIDQDCNDNGICDYLDIQSGLSQDCNANNVPDDCDIADGTSQDADGNGIPDECPLLLCSTFEQDLGYDGNLGDGGYATGLDLAISGDIAAVLDTNVDPPHNTFNVHFFHREQGQWIHEATRLFDDDESSLWWPRKSLDISGDTVIVGSTTGAGGRSTIYRRQGGQWNVESTFDEQGEWYYGLSVSISGDVAVVGSDVDMPGVRVYRRFGSTWLHETTLVQTLGEPTEWFGTDVAIDGNTVIVGSLSSGAWIFEYDGEDWIETQQLPTEGLVLGDSVDLEGDVAVVGRAHSLDVNHALVYRRTGGLWAPEQALESQEPKTRGLGYAVRISGDLIAVSSGINYNWPDDSDVEQGRVHLFRFEDDQWNEIEIFKRPELPVDWMPSPRVDLSGNQIAIGFMNDFLFTEVSVFTVPPANSAGQDDCNFNGICDELDIASGLSVDCDGNGALDSCDIADGLYLDVDSNGIPDTCETDCDSDLIPDHYEIEQGLELDCNNNGVPDSCDLASGHSPDTNGDGIPDECDTNFVITVATDGSAMFEDIQSALDLSVSGSTILVSPGVYLGPVVLPTHPVVLVSEVGSEATFILGNTDATALSIVNQQSRETVVDGFSMTGGDVTWRGGGLLIANAAPTIRNCDIVANRAARGGGLYVVAGAPLLENCHFRGNESVNGGGGGLAINRSSVNGDPVEFMNCLISTNTATQAHPPLSGGGGGLAAFNAIVDLRNTRFEYNHAGLGGAFHIGEQGLEDTILVTMNQCEFEDNTGLASVGQIWGVSESSMVSLQDSTLCGHDFNDISGGNWQDLGGNVAYDSCDCPDTNGDGSVDVNDILAVIDAWGDCPPDDDCPADVDLDGTVGVNDVLLIISEWGECL